MGEGIALAGGDSYLHQVEYLGYLARELRSPINYVVALLVGAAILIFQGYSPFQSAIPYVVPVLVQALSKSGVKYRNRLGDLLLKLPQERVDPALVANRDGLIVAATGRTQELLDTHSISSVQDLILSASCPDLPERLREAEEQVEITCFSDITRKWYRLQARQADRAEHLLVWLEDLSEEVRLESRLGELQQFTADLVDQAAEGRSPEELTAELAKRVLRSGYSAIFVTQDDEGTLDGRVYRFVQGELRDSDRIRIPSGSSAPILLSARRSRVVSAAKAPEQPQRSFEIDHPFDERVKEFVGEPIENFVNYAYRGVAVIAFNNRHGVSEYEERYIESVVNVFRIAYRLAS